MAETYIDLPVVESALVDADHPETNFSNLSTYNIATSYSGWTKLLLLTFQEPTASIKSKRLYRVTVVGQYKDGVNDDLAVYAVNNSYIPGLVTWNTKPATSINIGPSAGISYSSAYKNFEAPDWSRLTSQYPAAKQSEQSAWALVGNGIGINGRSSYYTSSPITVKTDTLAVRVYYDDSASATSQVEATNSPTSGYVNPRTATSFSWQFKPSGSYYPVSPYSQTSATFYWRVKNASTWNSVSAGTAQSKSISANTFPTASTIQWYVSATDTYGTTSNTATYEFSTAAGAVTATPVSPADSVEDNSADIEFKWNVTSADGQPQSGSELQYSTNGSSWTALGTVSGSGTSYVCPANTLPSGTIYWRVRASNIDGTAGAWSSAVTFISFGAPAAPSVTVTERNFATVNWQADVQEAYRITVDGAVIGPIFGTERTYDLPEPLRAGTHTVSVEVQNSFGLWSQPGTANVTVTEGIDYLTRIVSVKGKIDAVITYNIDPRYTAVSAIYLYRDGIKIASLPVQLSNGQTYVDRFVLGRHSYQIIVRYTSGFGSFTDTVSTEITSCGAPRIAPFSGGEWMKLRLSETTRRTEGFSRQRQISLRHFTGAEYPVAEVSTYSDASGSYDCAFDNVGDANAFEALFGQVVILKTKAENVVIGVLSGYEKQVNRHYIAYTFTIQRIYWRDYLDLTTD